MIGEARVESLCDWESHVRPISSVSGLLVTEKVPTLESVSPKQSVRSIGLVVGQ